MERRCIKILWFSVSFYIATAQLEKCDKCTTNNKPDLCILINDLPFAIENVKKQIYPIICSFDIITHIVCCEAKADISDQKCRQYSEEFNQRTKRQNDKQILEAIGGSDAVLGLYRHMAGLGYGPIDKVQWLCGGSLISHKFILTAAHCLNHPELGPVSQIRLGNVKLDGIAGVHKDYQISRRIPNPEYNPPSAYNDIALLELSQGVEFTIYIKPACLYSNHDTSNLVVLVATGWGLTQFGGSSSNILQEVILNLFSLEECNAIYKNNLRKLPDGIRDSQQICYGGRDVERDTCDGDSGDPIQVINELNLYNIVGITSLGKSCGTANIPAVYTRVSNYIPWIESIVWP